VAPRERDLDRLRCCSCPNLPGGGVNAGGVASTAEAAFAVFTGVLAPSLAKAVIASSPGGGPGSGGNGGMRHWPGGKDVGGGGNGRTEPSAPMGHDAGTKSSRPACGPPAHAGMNPPPTAVEVLLLLLPLLQALLHPDGGGGGVDCVQREKGAGGGGAVAAPWGAFESAVVATILSVSATLSSVLCMTNARGGGALGGWGFCSALPASHAAADGAAADGGGPFAVRRMSLRQAFATSSLPVEL